MSTLSPLDTWHRMVRSNDATDLAALVAEDAVFHSPVVHSPQRGRKLTVMYLSAAFQVFFNPTFRYVREIVGTSDAMLEFETEIDGILVNGVDIITWNDAGLITGFKVMIRPLKGIAVIHRKMGEMLQAAQKPAA
jgi:hypothetical protein